MKNLRNLREERKMTQQQVADILKLQRPTYTRYENGEREPDNETLIKLSELFDVSVDYLLGKTDDPKPNPLDKKLEGIDFALWGEVKDLSDDQKQDVIDFVEFIKSKGKK